MTSPQHNPNETNAPLTFNAILQNLGNCNAKLNIDGFLCSENIMVTKSMEETATEESTRTNGHEEQDISWLKSANNDRESSKVQQRARHVVQDYLSNTQPDKLAKLQAQAVQAAKDAELIEKQLQDVVEDINKSALM